MSNKRKQAVEKTAEVSKETTVFRVKPGEKAAVACGKKILPLTGPVTITVEKG